MEGRTGAQKEKGVIKGEERGHYLIPTYRKNGQVDVAAGRVRSEKLIEMDDGKEGE